MLDSGPIKSVTYLKIEAQKRAILAHPSFKSVCAYCNRQRGVLSAARCEDSLIVYIVMQSSYYTCVRVCYYLEIGLL